jgi:hypothetical protein
MIPSGDEGAPVAVEVEVEVEVESYSPIAIVDALRFRKG